MTALTFESLYMDKVIIFKSMKILAHPIDEVHQSSSKYIVRDILLKII